MAGTNGYWQQLAQKNRLAQTLRNAPVESAIHWLFPHNPLAHPGAQAHQAGHDLVQTFDPRSPSGLANVLSMFVGGPEGEDILNSNLEGGNFTKYNLLHTADTGQIIRFREGQPMSIQDAILASRRGSPTAAKDVHDALFGGEVHAKGPIPQQPKEPTYTPEEHAIANSLGIHPGRVRAQMEAVNRANELAAKANALARIVHNHFSPDNGYSGLNKISRVTARRMAQSHRGTTDIRSSAKHFGSTNPKTVFEIATGRKNQPSIAGKPDPIVAAKARQAELARMVQQQLHNHRN